MKSQRDFAALTKEWDKKLKKSGFEDIEQPNGQLKTWSSQFYRPTKTHRGTVDEDKVAVLELKSEYYRLAEHFLNQYKFESKYEKAAWKLHSEGKSYRTIVNSLKFKFPNNEFAINKDSVNSLIKGLAKQMIIDVRTEEQDEYQED